jgi:hypothetical protein
MDKVAAHVVIKSILAGAASAFATFFASTITLGYIDAVQPHTGTAEAVWQIVVFYVLGATLVALLIHCVAIYLLRARASIALAAFLLGLLVALALTGPMTYAARPLAAWLVGGCLASLLARGLRSNNSFKPNPLRSSKTPSDLSGGSA